MSIIWVLLIIAIVATAAFVFLRTKKKRGETGTARMVEKLGIPNIPANWTGSDTTPLGARRK